MVNHLYPAYAYYAKLEKFLVNKRINAFLILSYYCIIFSFVHTLVYGIIDQVIQKMQQLIVINNKQAIGRLDKQASNISKGVSLTKPICLNL